MKKIISVMLCLIMLFAVSVSASADVLVQYEDWLLSDLDNGAAWEIRGYSGDDTDITLINYVGKVRVISVGSLAFKDNEQLISVTGVPLLQIIKEYAFLNSVTLKTVILPGTVYRIDRGAFFGANALESINLQDTSITSVSEDTFRDTSLKQIILPDSCGSIGDSAFAGCASLTKAVIPNSVTEIADDAFDGADSVVIYANHDAYSIEYAAAHNIPYVLLDELTLSYCFGDADGDGAVTIIDATRIQRVLADLEPDEDGMSALRGHVCFDLDGELSILDATRIQRWLADYTVEPVQVDEDHPAVSVGDELTRTIRLWQEAEAPAATEPAATEPAATESA